MNENDIDKKLADIEEFCVKLTSRKEIDDIQEPVSPLRRRNSFTLKNSQESQS